MGGVDRMAVGETECVRIPRVIVQRKTK